VTPADLEIAQLTLPMSIDAPTQAIFADPNTGIHQPNMSQANTQKQARNTFWLPQMRRLETEAEFLKVPKHLLDMEPDIVKSQYPVKCLRSGRQIREDIPGFIVFVVSAPAATQVQRLLRQSRKMNVPDEDTSTGLQRERGNLLSLSIGGNEPAVLL
jgi:hypothetical protein